MGRHVLPFIISIALCAGCSNDALQWEPTDGGADWTEVTSDAGPVPNEDAAPRHEDVVLPDLLDDPPPTLGGDRPATYYVPGGASPADPMPLLVLLHGYSVSGAMQELYFALSDTTLAMGVFLITPDGTTNAEGVQFWNAMDACCNGYGSDVDDVAYILELIDEASAYFPIDPKRVYLAGHSNGGFMSHRVACDAPERIAGIMSLAGTTWEHPNDCGDPAPVAVLHVHGTEDDVIHYDGVVGSPGVSLNTLGDPTSCLAQACGAEQLACDDSPGCTLAFQCALACDHQTCVKGCLSEVEQDGQLLFSELVGCAMDHSCLDVGALGFVGYASAQATAERWGDINGCDDTPVIGAPLDLEVTVGGAETTVTDWQGCAPGAEVSLWTMNEVDHIPIFGPDWAPAFVGWLLEQKRP